MRRMPRAAGSAWCWGHANLALAVRAFIRAHVQANERGLPRAGLVALDSERAAQRLPQLRRYIRLGSWSVQRAGLTELPCDHGRLCLGSRLASSPGEPGLARKDISFALVVLDAKSCTSASKKWVKNREGASLYMQFM